ncbi:hypothetical protein Z043_107209 [Scleropages formosus]|uniref:Uncharacterized protein n=1 Tax=Scleropages formosus TaxID=113540 RepID=A0A0P7VEA6_SCLFO|nr:hypothetical protein Z043_107209 [Scleropages formosus]
MHGFGLRAPPVMPVYIIDRKVPDAPEDTLLPLVSHPPSCPVAPGEYLQATAALEEQLVMTDNLTPKAAKKVRWTSLEISLITIVSLLFIALVALTVLFVTHRQGERCRRQSSGVTCFSRVPHAATDSPVCRVSVAPTETSIFNREPRVLESS